MTTQDFKDQVAWKLQILAPVPEPDLAAGRRRFLEAARQTDAGELPRAAKPHPADGMGRLVTRPQAALVAVAVLVLLTAVTMSVAAMMGEWTGPTRVPQLATPALSPTFTATPTRMVGVAVPAGAPVFMVGTGASSGTTTVKQLVAPRQRPTPDPQGEFIGKQQISILKWHSLNG